MFENGLELKVSQTPFEVRVGSNNEHHSSISFSSFVSCDKITDKSEISKIWKIEMMLLNHF